LAALVLNNTWKLLVLDFPFPSFPTPSCPPSSLDLFSPVILVTSVLSVYISMSVFRKTLFFLELLIAFFSHLCNDNGNQGFAMLGGYSTT
jgi:hypothetical protein